jgi:hypothetical protein
MDAYDDQTHYMKRVVLPGGKTIEVVYTKAPERPPAGSHQEDLHVCLECSSDLVYPAEWEKSGPGNWSVLLHCPNCDVHRKGVFSDDAVEAFDEELDRGADTLNRDYKRLMRANMAAEIERFVGALNADAILPEDF